MSGSSEDSEEDEAGRNRGVQNTQEDNGWDHERKADLLVQFVAKGSKGGCSVVLVSSVGVDDGTDKREENNFSNGDGPQSLGEVARVLHFSDERRQGDLSDECVTDVHECRHSGDKGGASLRDCKHARLSKLGVPSRVILDTGEDGGQDD